MNCLPTARTRASRTCGIVGPTCGLLFLAACDSGTVGGRSGPSFERWDSAGVEIVENRAPQHGDLDAWIVDSVPSLQVGVVDGEAAYQFTQIWSAVRFPDGRLAIADGVAYEIRVFAADGTHLVTFGGRGQGPGEFGGPPWLRAGSSETIVAWDPGQYRLSWFDLTGQLLEDQSLAAAVIGMGFPRFVNGLVWSLTPEASLLWTGPGPGGRDFGLSDSVRHGFVIADRGAITRDFGTFQLEQIFTTLRVEGGREIGIGIGNPWVSAVELTLGSDPLRVVISSPDLWEVRFFDVGGALFRVLRAEIPRIPVTPDEVERERARMPEIAERMRIPVGQAMESFAQFAVPDSVGIIASLRFDTSGNLWVGRRRGYQLSIVEHDVFAADGRWLTRTTVPEELGRILDITDDHLLAVWSDDLGVPYLRVHRIAKPGAPR